MSSSLQEEHLLDDSRSATPRRKKKKHRRSSTRHSGRRDYPPSLDHSIVSPSSLSESFIAVPLSSSPSASSLSSSTSFTSSTLSVPSTPTHHSNSHTSRAAATQAATSSSILFIYLISLLAMLIAGTAYNFSSWSPDLKQKLHYTQSQLELVGYSGNFPGFVQPFVGVLCNRYRPAVTAIAAAVLMATGYIGLGLGVSGWSGTSWISNPAVMAVCNGCVILGVTNIYTITLAVNVVNLPTHRLGAGIAVLVMFYGLSASLFSLLYVYVLHSSLLAYFFLCAALCSAICLLNAVTLKKYDNGEKHGTTNGASEHITSADDLANPATPTSPYAAIEEAGTTRTAALSSGSLMSVFHVLFLMLRSPLFYAYFFIMFFVGGAGYVTINNTGNVIESLNGGVPDDSWTFVCIVVLSMCNGLGRLLVSTSDLLPIRRGWYAVASATLMAAVYAYNLFLVNSTRSWLLSAIGAGLAYGSMWAITPVLTAETWPRALFGITWGWVAASPAIASLVFNAIVGVLYDRRAVNHVCVGVGCWHDAFVLGVVISVVGLCIAIAMTQYTLIGKQAKKKQKVRSGSVQQVEEGDTQQRR